MAANPHRRPLGPPQGAEEAEEDAAGDAPGGPSVQPDLRVDARGMPCPLPVLKAQRALRALPSGGVLALLATDPGAAQDIPAFCRERGHDLLGVARRDGATLFTIRRGAA